VDEFIAAEIARKVTASGGNLESRKEFNGRQQQALRARCRPRASWIGM